jgi:DNA transformation protein
MPSDPSFVAHVLDLVGLVGPVSARAMFGGHGVYAEGVMFALLDDGELFLKTDELTRARFVEAGCRQWLYVNKAVRMENTGYFRPPDDAHEDPEAMAPWARLALEAALRAHAERVARKARAARRGAKPAKGTRPAPRTASGKGKPTRSPVPKTKTKTRRAPAAATKRPAGKAKVRPARAARRRTR